MKEDEMCGLYGINGEIRNDYTLLVGSSEGRTPLGRSMRRWENNININLRELGCEEVHGRLQGGCKPEAKNLISHPSKD
jgi:hypothetical protein